MRKVKIVGAVFCAALAIGVVAASSASAAQWLLNGAAITKATPATTSGTWLLLGLSFFGTVKTHVICNGKLIGTVGPGSADEVSEVQSLTGEKNTINCEMDHNELGGCPGALLVLVTAEKLPWTSKLEAGIVDKFGNAAFKVECTLSGGSKSSELCEGPSVTKKLVNVSTGVEGEIENALSSKCNTSGTVSHVFASGITVDNEGGVLSVS
jgi:hypothetical protein